MHLFFASNPEEFNLLTEEESQHAAKALRLKPGDKIQIADGNGFFYNAILTDYQKKQLEFKVLETYSDHFPTNFHIHIAVAPTKNADRIEWFLEKSVEMGIHEVSFFSSDRTEKKNINMERLEKIALSAMKQSGKATLPKINPIQKLSDFLQNTHSEVKTIGHLEKENKIYLSEVAKNKSYTVLIGPEGDFTTEEIALAKNYGFISVSLGNWRLRTETAALMACSILNQLNFR